jgi:creatinine amidohydrolase
MIATHDLSELTWQEVEATAQQGAVVVLPTGAHEQHGPHLPLGTDAMLVTAVTRRAVEIARPPVPVYYTPTIWLGFSPHHMDFPGTISLSMTTYLAVVAEACRSLWQHGFRRLVLINGHGGNAAPLRTVVSDLRAREGIRVAVVSYWDLAAPFIKAWRRSEEGGINHACEMETALMLHVHRHLVRMDRAVRHIPVSSSIYLSRDLVAPGRVTVGSRVRDKSPTGIMGDPTVATPERGEVLFNAMVAEMARLIEDVATWD